MIDEFVTFSVEVTGFSAFALRGTGQAEAYLEAVVGVVGSSLVRELLDAHAAVPPLPAEERDAQLRRAIFGDEKLGPIARNVIKMWYLGIWYELPYAWNQAFGALEKNVTFMVSAAAYTEGLLWPAAGSHPSGAKAPGYASWVGPPDFDTI